jgi:serine/threonine protein kinase
VRMGGVTEVASELGVSRQRVSKLRERTDFPDPVGELAQGPIWDLDAVQAWNGSGLRSSSGRPKAGTAARILGGRFVLEEKIGRGGFADVYRAADRKQGGDRAAVKVLHEVAAVEPEAIRRFQRELRLLEGLEHPNVISILAHGEIDDENIWYAMPLAQGSLLDAVHEVTGQPLLILDVMRQVCLGLGHIHEQGIFHRDLKPGNILRTADGRWSISDFGLAVEVERNTTMLTSTLRAGLGSFWYTAPEQWKAAREADHRSDIYSLGKVLQELVSGEAPVTSDMPASPLRPVVQRATATQPADRHQSVAEFLAAVESAVEAPKGTWESPEDSARRILERVRLPKPAVEDLDGLLSWARSLDEDVHDEMEALSRVLPWISSWSIRQLWARDSGAFRRVYEHFSEHVRSAGFGFDYCDVIADFTRKVVEETKDGVVLRAAVHSLAELGASHNRWYVRDVLTAILQTVKGDEMAVAATEGLRSARRSSVEWSVTDFSLRTLHPVLRAAVGSYLAQRDAG